VDNGQFIISFFKKEGIDDFIIAPGDYK